MKQLLVSTASLCVLSLPSLQSHAAENNEGFMEGASSSINFRNLYMERDYFGSTAQNRSKQWAQGLIFKFDSGFTEGTVGFGLDVLAKGILKLDGGAGTVGDVIAADRGDGPPRDLGRIGLAAKVKVSATELKGGEFMLRTPLIIADDGRAMPQTYQGVLLSSREIPNLTLTAGQIYGSAAKNDSSMNRLKLNGFSATSNNFTFGGAEYAIPGTETSVAAWYGKLTDIYDQKNIELINLHRLSEALAIRSTLRYWWGEDAGAAKAGSLSNQTASGMFDFLYGPHTLRLGLQKISGDNAWFRLSDACPCGIVANDSLTNASTNAKEKSWQVRYDYNFAALGVPGLTAMARYISGTNVKTATTDNGSEWSHDEGIDYVFQSGSAKNLSIGLRHGTIHKSFNPSFNETRVIINYPISLL
ncbi:OprD family porin [Pseudomonas sp. NC26]|uniref:Outer membrane porin, OprD family n=1 Tax=Pseudomonas putida TaxID=303 RepID=A0A7W2L4Z8_PSEPU|nr:MULTISPECIES: OprD family outer membrane porin [Pseudomonas]MBA6118562.1 outer membrane porin, OprD family [Pseudomonas putida]MCZ9640792.1 OprD family porin [Pseudomonas putida]MEC4877822.1 OprD family porin [Pseudomonas sp. NC26]QNL90622.1 OprD family outer membrane low permeability porin [Pseudomonas putida]